MAKTIQVKFFNSFWLKKVNAIEDITNDESRGTWTPASTGVSSLGRNYEYYPVEVKAAWPGLPWQPSGYPAFNLNNMKVSDLVCPGMGLRPALSKDSYRGNPGSLEIPEYNITWTISNISGGWYVEESRIRGGFNNTGLSLGVRAYVVDNNKRQSRRSNSLIYSGLINTTTGFNETNVFSIAQPITRDLDPINGSIQKLYTEDTNLITLQENKVSKTLINKNAMYAGDQGSQDTAGIRFLGQSVAYAGEYGISKNPESFAIYGYRKYFADKNRSAILRLSKDGITEISSYGMRDYFRDELSLIKDEWQTFIVTSKIPTLTVTNNTISEFITLPDVLSEDKCNKIQVGSRVSIDGILTNSYVTAISVTSSPADGNVLVQVQPNISKPSGTYTNVNVSYNTYYKSKIKGGWDTHNKMYTVSMQKSPRFVDDSENSYSTVTFDETVLGWTSFFTYKPSYIISLKNIYYSCIDNRIFRHYTPNFNDTNRGVFYGVIKDSNVTFIFNTQPTVVKNFQTVAYEGSNGWEVDYFMSDFTGVNPDAPFNRPFTYAFSNEYKDTTSPIFSYQQGLYTDAEGVQFRSGFYRKENKYVSNLVNNSVEQPDEVIFGGDMSGIKGYFATVKFSTDNDKTLEDGQELKGTDVGGMKELFSVSSKYVISSI